MGAPAPAPATPIPQPMPTPTTAQQPIAEQPAPTSQAQPAPIQSPKEKRSFAAILPIILLFIIAVGMGVFAFIEMKQVNKANTEAADLRNQLANVKPECDQSVSLENSQIKEMVENFYKLRRISQKGSNEELLSFIGVNGFASTEIDEETNEVISKATFDSVRNAMRKFGTDNLANDFNLYKGLRSVDGNLRYQQAPEEAATTTYKDTIEDDAITLVKADNLHYTISITTKTYTSTNMSGPESTKIHDIDVYFIVDKDDKFILNQVVEN